MSFIPHPQMQQTANVFNKKQKTLCIIHTVEHNYISPSSKVGIQLHWVQLHVSAL